VRGCIYRRPVGADDTIPIAKCGEPLGDIIGSWLGYLDIDDVRYWDVREAVLSPTPAPSAAPLPSDSRHRDDLRYLLEDNAQLAQEYGGICFRDMCG
jgi:hypothetical protein